MIDESLRDHFVLLTTYAMVCDEVMAVVQARAATGSYPMLVDVLMKSKGKGKGKKGKCESKDTKSKDDKGKSRGWKNRTNDCGDKSEKVSALQATDETPPVASVTLAADFDGYFFAITMESSWNETLCPLMRPPIALARRRECNADVSWSFCVLVDRFWICCRRLPA